MMLSAWIGVGGCSWPISRSVVWIGSESRQLMKMMPISDSVAEDITFRIMEESICMGPLGMEVVVLDR